MKKKKILFRASKMTQGVIVLAVHLNELNFILVTLTSCPTPYALCAVWLGPNNNTYASKSSFCFWLPTIPALWLSTEAGVGRGCGCGRLVQGELAQALSILGWSVLNQTQHWLSPQRTQGPWASSSCLLMVHPKIQAWAMRLIWLGLGLKETVQPFRV